MNVKKIDMKDATYSKKHLQEFLMIIKDLLTRGITPDTDATNILYNKGDGFYVIDYQLSNMSSHDPVKQIKNIPKVLLESLEGKVTNEEYTKKLFYLYKKLGNEFINFCKSLEEVEQEA